MECYYMHLARQYYHFLTDSYQTRIGQNAHFALPTKEEEKSASSTQGIKISSKDNHIIPLTNPSPMEIGGTKLNPYNEVKEGERLLRFFKYY